MSPQNKSVFLNCHVGKPSEFFKWLFFISAWLLVVYIQCKHPGSLFGTSAAFQIAFPTGSGARILMELVWGGWWINVTFIEALSIVLNILYFTILYFYSVYHPEFFLTNE